MSVIRTWLGGFAWGAVFGVAGATTAGIMLFRPDVIERITMERPAAPASQAASAPKAAPAPPLGTPAGAPSGAPSAAAGPPAAARPSEIRQTAAPQIFPPPNPAPAPAPAQAPAPTVVKAPPFIVNSRTTAALEQVFSPPRAFARNDALVVRGRNMNSEPVEFIVRIDDAASSNWTTRFNRLDTLPPGPFEVRVPFESLMTPDKTELDIGAISRIVLFSQKGVLDIDAAQIETKK
ncbi:hypothetical protein V5F77_13620 [Xanthobacter sp. DSM 24535]|uniref:hypothetical protein n=1 Tax=Roseixanthobacter psychrophilus TaxID=3119917 RepID=UPI0037295AE1